MNLTKQQQSEIGGYVRLLTGAIGGALLAFGTITPDQSNALVALAGTAFIAATGIWSTLSKRK